MSDIDDRLDNDYVKWLIYDQAQGLLRKSTAEICNIFGISRQALWYKNHDNKLDSLPYGGVVKLQRELEAVKAALLVTEANDD